MDTEFCVNALKKILTKGKPDVFNTDQGVQFTRKAFTEALESQDIWISMDGKDKGS